MSKETHVQGVAGLKKSDIKPIGIAMMLFGLVAAGAFGIEDMISSAGPGMTLILLIIFPIIWAYPLCNLVAESGSAMPSEGGIYVWVKEAFGEFWGFQAGWWGTLSTYLSTGAFVALIAGYTSQIIPMSEMATFVLKIGIVIIFTVINLLGLKEVESVAKILSVLIFLAFALVTVVGLINWHTNPMVPVIPEGSTVFDGISGGIALCIWMYCGYEGIANISGEVKDPQAVPKGVLIAMPLIALSYILPTLAGLVSLPAGSWAQWSSDGGLVEGTIGYATVLTEHIGPIGGYFFLFVAILSNCSLLNNWLTAGSRGFFVLADENLAPKSIKKVSKKRGVPYVGILSLSIVTLVLCQADFTTLVSITVVFMLALYIILPCAVIKMRKIIPVEERTKRGLYVMKGGKVGLAYFTGFPIVIAVISLMINGTDYLATGLIGLCSGPVAYVIFKKMYGGFNKLDPENNPLNSYGLAAGDTVRLGIFLALSGFIAFVGQFWLRWYEIDYGG